VATISCVKPLLPELDAHKLLLAVLHAERAPAL
jgi:hypothetical protein